MRSVVYSMCYNYQPRCEHTMHRRLDASEEGMEQQRGRGMGMAEGVMHNSGTHLVIQLILYELSDNAQSGRRGTSDDIVCDSVKSC